ncbi:MAG: hypothetical protein P1U37_06685 [Minwuia sp.]|nr:hypothetical protein [Minwuia sp.]
MNIQATFHAAGPGCTARRRPPVRVILALALGLGLGFMVHAPASARPAIGDVFSGPARIIDGDTLMIGGQSIRLFGIDTPERGQPGFAAATRHLRAITAGGAVTCHTVDVDRYRRAVGMCRTGPRATVTEQQETLSEMILRSCHARRLSRWDHVVSPGMRTRLDQARDLCTGTGEGDG